MRLLSLVSIATASAVSLTAATYPVEPHVVISPTLQILGTDSGSKFQQALADAAQVAPEDLARLGDHWQEWDRLAGVWLGVLPTRDPDHVYRRGPWELRQWGSGSKAMLVLSREGQRQIAWRGWFRPVEEGLDWPPPGEDPHTFDDLDGDGTPDLLVYGFSGGGSCCTTVYQFSLGEVATLEAEIFGGATDPAFRDVDSEGTWEIVMREDHWSYWKASGAASPMPLVAWSREGGAWHVSPRHGRAFLPTEAELKTQIEQIRQYYAGYDRFLALKRRPEAALSEEERAFVKDWQPGRHGWRGGDVGIDSDIWALILPFLYAGEPERAAELLKQVWPADDTTRASFAQDLYAELQQSPIGRQLHAEAFLRHILDDTLFK
ncbi:MAG: hypothetical protein E1N59_2980 [Puniceicoccaceae bacterium 5H]|nr:MAG: hypothetical protein E1N59_2980 [Puniceicoccaceae bacterium 5H]